MANHHRQACRNTPGACEGVRHTARIAQAARKIPHADDSPDNTTAKRRPQTKIALKEEPQIPRLPASYCVPARSAYGSRQFFPCDEPLHDATLLYGRGRPRLLTEVSSPALPRFRKKFCLSAPCFRPFSCIDIDTRNVYDYILNFVEQFQHITRQICSPIAARP